MKAPKLGLASLAIAVAVACGDDATPGKTYEPNQPDAGTDSSDAGAGSSDAGTPAPEHERLFVWAEEAMEGIRDNCVAIFTGGERWIGNGFDDNVGVINETDGTVSVCNGLVYENTGPTTKASCNINKKSGLAAETAARKELFKVNLPDSDNPDESTTANFGIIREGTFEPSCTGTSSVSFVETTEGQCFIAEGNRQTTATSPDAHEAPITTCTALREDMLRIIGEINVAAAEQPSQGCLTGLVNPGIGQTPACSNASVQWAPDVCDPN